MNKNKKKIRKKEKIRKTIINTVIKTIIKIIWIVETTRIRKTRRMVIQNKFAN